METYCFCSISSYYYYYSLSLSISSSGFFFFPPKFCSDKFIATPGQIILKFGNTVEKDVKLCKRVSKFKMWTLRLSYWRAQNCQNFVWPISY